MTIKWWPMQITCTGCNQVVPLNGFCFSADGEVQFWATCDPCKALVHFETYATKLAHAAMMNDIADDKGTVKTEVREIPAPTFTAEDLSELKAFHILDEEI